MADLMNPGGGLTNSKLLLADANPGDVVSHKKFYSNGNKEVQTGTLHERGVETATSTALYNNDLYYRIPFGAYRTPSGSDGGTEVKASKSAALSAFGIPNSVSFTFSGTCTANGYTLASTSAKVRLRFPGFLMPE